MHSNKLFDRSFISLNTHSAIYLVLQTSFVGHCIYTFKYYVTTSLVSDLKVQTIAS